jgi:hypothetical protein
MASRPNRDWMIALHCCPGRISECEGAEEYNIRLWGVCTIASERESSVEIDPTVLVPLHAL